MVYKRHVNIIRKYVTCNSQLLKGFYVFKTYCIFKIYNEKIKISLPLSLIQSESECGGNVQIGWPMGTEPGPVLYRGEIDACDKEEHENKRPRLSSDS